MTKDTDLRIAELERRVAALEASSAEPRVTPAGAAGGKTSPREFLLEHAPKSDNDKTLAAGYYIEVIGGAESFDFDDIERFYAAAKEPAPANRRDPPYQNVRRGYFIEIGKREFGKTARNRWRVSNRGHDRVKSRFTKS